MKNTPEFAALGLAEPLLRAIDEAGYTEPTPIQAMAIPRVLAGVDLLAAAQTGTGKTAGFALPILQQHLTRSGARPAPGHPRVLILTPTRELAAQIEASFRLYAKHTNARTLVIFGGVNINPQIAALRKPVDILVATPGRLLDHVGQKTLHLDAVQTLVLDEADRMLDMGFIHDIRRVLRLLPAQRQSLLFSATFSNEIRTLAKGMLHEPEEVSVARRNTTAELVEQSVVLTHQSHKRDLLSHIIRNSGWHQVLVFTRTKHGANRLAEKLSKDGLVAAAIHGNKSQAARTRALSGFKSGKLTVLVATDIAARGLDIDHLPQVVNFELPNVPEDYVHRIGRTGRAGSVGAALSLVDSEHEIKLLRGIERLIGQDIPRQSIEGWNPREMVTTDSAPDAREQRTFARMNQNGDARRRDGGPRGASGSARRPAPAAKRTPRPRHGNAPAARQGAGAGRARSGGRPQSRAAALGKSE